MRKCQKYIFLTLLSFWPAYASSQNCTVPEPPVLRSVSIQPETGKTDLVWSLSPSSGIAAYVIYSYKNGDGTPLDTLWNPAATEISLPGTASKYFSVSYVVASMRLPVCTSIFSNVLNSIFTKADIDTCSKKIVVSWNSYPSVPKKVSGYSVLVSINGGAYTEVSVSAPDVNSIAITDFITNSDYCFVVRANLEGGSSSSSNKACLSTKMQRAPGWINADYATVSPDRKISLSFTIDPFSEVTHFRLERKKQNSDNFSVIEQLISAGGSVVYTDQKASSDSIFNYRLSAVNNCNISVTTSNTASNIVLKLHREGNDLNFSWNHYREWRGQVSAYRMFINTGSGFEERFVIHPPDTALTINYKDLMYQVSGSEACFYISASEISNPNGITGLSLSSVSCTTPTEIITVPNVFTPDNDLVNDFFKPVLSFTPSDYHLIISDRHSNVLFETRDYNEEWDGAENGNPVPHGVYIWFLKVTAPSGKRISKTGSVTIVSQRQ
jgi:gliding motility-associated-like protein